MIVAFDVAGEAWACLNFEIGGLIVDLALSCFRKNFHTVVVLFYLSQFVFVKWQNKTLIKYLQNDFHFQ